MITDIIKSIFSLTSTIWFFKKKSWMFFTLVLMMLFRQFWNEFLITQEQILVLFLYTYQCSACMRASGKTLIDNKLFNNVFLWQVIFTVNLTGLIFTINYVYARFLRNQGRIWVTPSKWIGVLNWIKGKSKLSIAFITLCSLPVDVISGLILLVPCTFNLWSNSLYQLFCHNNKKSY
jgi:hypothetical protein